MKNNIFSMKNDKLSMKNDLFFNEKQPISLKNCHVSIKNNPFSMKYKLYFENVLIFGIFTAVILFPSYLFLGFITFETFEKI